MLRKQKSPPGLSNPCKTPQRSAARMLKISQYEAESIIDVKIQKGRRYYLIKWKGYSDKENTWEPIQNLTNLAADILLFERAHQERIKQLEKEWNQLYQINRVEEPLNKAEVQALKGKRHLQSNEDAAIFEVRTKQIKKHIKPSKKKQKKVSRKIEGRQASKAIVSQASSEQDKVFVNKTIIEPQNHNNLQQKNNNNQANIKNTNHNSEQPNQQNQQVIQKPEQSQRGSDQKPRPFYIDREEIHEAHDIIEPQSIDNYHSGRASQLKKVIRENSDTLHKQKEPKSNEIRQDNNMKLSKEDLAEEPKEFSLPQKQSESNTHMNSVHSPKDKKKLQRAPIENTSKLSLGQSNNRIIERSITKYTYRTKRKPIFKCENGKQSQKNSLHIVDMQLFHQQNLPNIQVQPHPKPKQQQYVSVDLRQNVNQLSHGSKENFENEKEDTLREVNKVESFQLAGQRDQNPIIINRQQTQPKQLEEDHGIINPSSPHLRHGLDSDSPITQLRSSRYMRLVDDSQSSEENPQEHRRHQYSSQRGIRKSRKIEKDCQKRSNLINNQTSIKQKRQILGFSANHPFLQQLQTDSILRGMISLHELTLSKPILYRVLRSFKLQGSIVLGVEVAVQGKLQERFIPYSLMRDQYPRELLIYLEEEQRLNLDNE